SIFVEAAANLRAHLHMFWCAGGKTDGTSLVLADGALTPGTTENLVLTLKNLGMSASETVSVELTSVDPYVTITTGTWAAGELAGRAEADNAGAPFQVAVAGDCPTDHAIRFDANITFGGHTVVKSFIIGEGGLCDPNDTYQYVVITSQAIRDSGTDPDVYDLLNHKKARGLTATVVTIEDIMGASSYAGVDDPETLRNFIIDAYNNWETEFVVLGGDTGIIPLRR
ncbi:unnamed protein product, partial [marine sediment metagenome]